MKITAKLVESDQTLSANMARSEHVIPTDVRHTTLIHDGRNGATFTPSVSEDGVISWTNDRDMPNPAPVNIKGVKGDKGDKGEQGIQGVRGDKGDDGAPGAPGAQGIQGVQGAKGDKGDKGEKGDTGSPGKDGYTPIKGADYFTEADKAEMVSAVLASIPVYNGEVVSV